MLLRTFAFAALIIIIMPGCYKMRKSRGGGQINTIDTRRISPEDIALPKGYKIQSVTNGLTFPSAATFDDRGNLYVIETGYSYGEVFGEPKLIKIGKEGTHATIATGTQNGPWTGLAFHNGAFYVSEGGATEGGKILKITTDGKITPLVSNLPSFGDHHTDQLVIKDGYIYFGQGTATNSAVVGPDNAEFGWLKRKSDFHDIPCADITLKGVNYTSTNPLTGKETDTVVTGAYSPFGTATVAGQVIKGACPCNGALLRIPVDGGKPELVAWGFRNPFGVAVSPDGKLFVTDNAYDDRGSRPVWGAGDVLWEVQQGKWYGWPDFSAGKPIQNDEEFKVPGKPPVQALLASYPNTPPKPAAILGVHSSSNGFDFSRNENFGYKGEAFVAQFGDMAPKVGKVMAPVGFKVVRVNTANGVINDFAVNRGKRNGPANWLNSGGLERPLSVKFDPVGTAMYIVDFGIMKMTDKGPEPQLKTGVIWKVTRQ